ncbi:MAG: hypothetical protein J1E56_04565 [Ruminococcus sp.]|nr:hypothetical protein [Ruminococcus sp.]
MTGLEKIIEEIRTEAALNAEKVISKAKNEADVVISDAQEKGKKQADLVLENAKKKSQDILSRGDSSANLEKQKAMLSAKQQVINEMLDNTLSYMENLEDKEYFSLILKLIENNSQPQKGEIAFSKKDISRLPADFIEKVNSVSKGKLSLSENTANIKSGFVLIYGGIEENCSFDSMFRSKHEELTDEISALLFSE